MHYAKLPLLFALVFAAPCLAPGAARAQPARVAGTDFDATFYHLEIDLRFGATPEADHLYGRTRVEGRADGAPLHVLALDFSSNMTVDSVRTPGGERLAFRHTFDLLEVTLPGTAAPGEAVAVDVFYRGRPAETGHGTFRFGSRPGGERIAWTLSEPYGAREWWPSVDHPSDKADSVRVTVTVPEGLRVASNGLLRAEHTAGGRTTFDWFSRYPIASYLVSFAAGPYDVYEQTYVRPDSLAAVLGPLAMPVVHYAYRGTTLFQGDSLNAGWHLVTDVLPVFEGWFGPYPFAAEKYGHAQFTWGGGMEHQTMTSMGGAGIGLVAHELAHQWYGDQVTLRYWPHLWLNEGFATYGELLYYQARPDRYAASYAYVFDLYYNRARDVAGTLIADDTTNVSVLFSGNRVYAKGAMVLHMLRGAVGDEAFGRILRAYAADPALTYGTATTADFERVAEAESGRDLDAFFRQWVTEGTGHPIYAVRWSHTPAADGARVTVTLEQTQSAQTTPPSNVAVFEMPVTFAVATDRGTERFTVWNDERVQTFTFDVAGTPHDVVFDPDLLILRNTPVEATAVVPLPGPPRRAAIAAAYPSPTSGVLHVTVELAAAGPLRLDLYDALGRRVRRLVDQPMPAGLLPFTFALDDLPAGAYFVRLEDTADTKPILILDF